MRHQTEWILLTSGTTGLPKIVVHTLSSLAGGIDQTGTLAGGFVWSTFYDIRRYGGLQIFLRAVLTGGSLVLSNSQETTAGFLTRAGDRGVTHITGTPSHWRRALMSPSAHSIAPQYIRLSGEIADQSILDNLRCFYPQAMVAHAFASTEAGLAFDVRDGLAGFPASLIDQSSGDVDMKVEDGSLRIRSARTAVRYIGQQGEALADADGFVDTGDMLELRGDRYYFVGRRDGVINVGGLKVHPEEVEAVINRHPQVRMSVVRTRKSPITGALVVADVVLRTSPVNGNSQVGNLEQEILQLCRRTLIRHKVPAAIQFVTDLPIAATGKMLRQPCVMSS
jgi:acyl-coenzyme A synthetase/AMP-(fatty) acid ligase